MSQQTPVYILIVNDHAEETKLATIGLRGFFPNCRIDVAYSPDEARVLASSQAARWALLLVDEGCLSGANAALIEDLKHHTLHAVAILQSDKSNSASAIGALQAGADYFLAKHSPAFLTELLFCAKEGLEKRALLFSTEHAEARYRQLVDTLSDAFFELDAEGMFVTVSPSIQPLLGYTPDELVGRSYSVLVPQEHLAGATFRFNERRSGSRSIRCNPLQLRTQQGDIVSLEISARGLYDSHRRFLGTVGLIHAVRSLDRPSTAPPVGQHPSPAGPLQDMHDRLLEMGHLLEAPMSSLGSDMKALLVHVQDMRLEERVQQLVDQAQSALDIGQRLIRILSSFTPDTVNTLVMEALKGVQPDDAAPARFVPALAPRLPRYQGDRDQTIGFLRHLLSYVERYLEAVDRPRQVGIKTGGAGFPDEDVSPSLFPLAPPSEVEITLSESEVEHHPAARGTQQERSADLPELYRMVRALGGTLEVSAPAPGPLRIVVRLPTDAPKKRESIVSAPQPDAAVPAQLPPYPTAASPTPSQAAPARTEERRAHSRVTTHLSARISLDATIWEGTIANVSMGGACLALPAEFPSIERQEASVVLRTAVGILEMNGTAFSRSEPTAESQPRHSSSQVVIIFQPPQSTEAAILKSMIEAAREQSVAFSLEATLTTEPVMSPASQPASKEEAADDDRREALRVPLSFPIRLETDHHRDPGARLAARTLDISREGACLLVKGSAGSLRGAVTLHFASGRTAGHPGAHEPGTPDSALAAEVVWALPDSSLSVEFRPDIGERSARVGVRFVSLTPFAEREVVRLVRQQLSSSQTSLKSKQVPAVLTVRRECRNQRGQAISIMDDHLTPAAAPEWPIVIVSPGFGETAANYTSFSRYAARHRFRVLRYDHTNHVGLSEGELQNTTLRGMQTDLAKVVDYVRNTWPTAPIAIVAHDLSARAALKMAAQTDPFDLLVLVNPVLDVKAQLATVHGHDLGSDYQYGLRRGIANLLGLNINVDAFVGDLTAGRLTDLQSSIEDIRLLQTPVCLVTTPVREASPLTPSDLPRTVMTTLDSRSTMLTLSTPLAVQDSASDESHQASFHKLLGLLSTQLNTALQSAEASPESPTEADQQRRIEREHLRLYYNVSQISREALALAHTQQLQHLANVHVYRKLLDDLYAFVGPFGEGTSVLDAGLGQSELSRALLVNHLYRTRQRGVPFSHRPMLVGIRRSGDTILLAKQNVLALQRELAGGAGVGVMTTPSLTLGWVQGEWMRSLPFQSQSLDRIVSNLSLPFAASPRDAILEWYRILKPGGRMAFTTFHPDSDLSAMYRHHLRLASQDEFGIQPQQVLHYMGRLREAICRGIVHSFSRSALGAVLRRLDQASFRVTAVLNGQAFAVVIEKRNSAGSL